MKLSNLYLTMAAVLFGVSFTSSADYCEPNSNKEKYPAYRQLSCSLQKWVDGSITPTLNKTLSSAQPSVELLPANLDFAGSISVRQSTSIFFVDKKSQNCPEIYESFKRQAGTTANMTYCDSGPYAFEKSSHYSGGYHCSIAGNIETCKSNELRVAANNVDLSFKIPQAVYGGELREIKKKNRIKINLGLVPILVGDITIFIQAEVTNRTPLSTHVTSRWGQNGDTFKSEVVPSSYFELSCVNNARINPL